MAFASRLEMKMPGRTPGIFCPLALGSFEARIRQLLPGTIYSLALARRIDNTFVWGLQPTDPAQFIVQPVQPLSPKPALLVTIKEWKGSVSGQSEVALHFVTCSTVKSFSRTSRTRSLPGNGPVRNAHQLRSCLNVQLLAQFVSARGIFSCPAHADRYNHVTQRS